MSEKFTLDEIYELLSIVGFDMIREAYDSLDDSESRRNFLEALNEYYKTEHWKKMPGYKEE
jgi:hypothetical protein